MKSNVKCILPENYSFCRDRMWVFYFKSTKQKAETEN